MEYCDKCGYVKQQCECEKPKTNADKIRNMDDAELAEFINGIDRYDDYAILINGDTVIDMTSCILEWLQTEAE